LYVPLLELRAEPEHMVAFPVLRSASSGTVIRMVWNTQSLVPTTGKEKPLSYFSRRTAREEALIPGGNPLFFYAYILSPSSP